MSDFLNHITYEGQRLDQIAYYYYGDIGLVPHILDFNPTLAIQRNYPAGLVIRIPIIQKMQKIADLPPWLR